MLLVIYQSHKMAGVIKRHVGEAVLQNFIVCKVEDRLNRKGDGVAPNSHKAQNDNR